MIKNIWIYKQCNDSILQCDFDKLAKWSNKRQTAFKCKYLQVGHGNSKKQYVIGNTKIRMTTKEKDLWVFFSSDFKVSSQYEIAAAGCLRVVKHNFFKGLIKHRYITKCCKFHKFKCVF